MYPPPPPVAPLSPEHVVKKRINVRSKGQRGEREIVDLLQCLIDPIRSKYHLTPVILQRNALQAHLGGADLHGLDGFSVEVKFQESAFQAAWWRQCLEQANKSRHGDANANAVPILFFRGSRQPWVVMFRAFVNSPLDRDQVEMDVTTSLADFISWFNESYDEACVEEIQRLK